MLFLGWEGPAYCDGTGRNVGGDVPLAFADLSPAVSNVVIVPPGGSWDAAFLFVLRVVSAVDQE